MLSHYKTQVLRFKVTCHGLDRKCLQYMGVFFCLPLSSLSSTFSTSPLSSSFHFSLFHTIIHLWLHEPPLQVLVGIEPERVTLLATIEKMSWDLAGDTILLRSEVHLFLVLKLWDAGRSFGVGVTVPYAKPVSTSGPSPVLLLFQHTLMTYSCTSLGFSWNGTSTWALSNHPIEKDNPSPLTQPCHTSFSRFIILHSASQSAHMLSSLPHPSSI